MKVGCCVDGYAKDVLTAFSRCKSVKLFNVARNQELSEEFKVCNPFAVKIKLDTDRKFIIA